MKKILGISLCALFAVSAANANIASTEWVLEEIGDPVRSVGTGTANGTISVDGTDVAVKGLGTAAYKSSDDFATGEEGDLAASALQQADVTTGGANGTISVKGTNVAVAGLGTAAYTSSGDYATSAQGALAASAVQPEDVTSGTANGTIAVDGTDVAVTGLGTAAYTSADAYATAEQGGKADTAVQEVVEGGTNGTISVDGTEVAVHGLGSAAYTNADAYATAAQGAKADDAVLEVVSGTANGTIKVDGTDVRVTGLQDLAYQSTIADADVAQNAAIATTKIAFSTQQTAALNSGITRESVNKIDENAGAIAINKTNIQSNSDDIVALKSRTAVLKALAYKDKVAAGDINPGAIVDADISDSARIATTKIAFSDTQKNALNSTIDSAKVTQIATNASNIGTLQTTVSEHNEALKPSSECMNNANGCTLVYRNNAYSWEKITREAQ